MRQAGADAGQVAELAVQRRGGLRADAGPARQAVARVAAEDGEGGSSGDDGGKDEPTYTVTIKGVDAATATFLLENYDNATAEQEQG